MKNRPTRSGGAILAFSILLGTGVGVARHQPSIGVLAGTAVGVLLLVVVWLADRR